MSKRSSVMGSIGFVTSSLFLAGSLSFASPTGADQVVIYNGPSVKIGEGTAHTFVNLDAAGKPVAIGVKFSESALRGLPAASHQGPERYEYRLNLPEEAKGAGYDHVGFDWNPAGHIPDGVYDTPHFDVHFYLINEAGRNLITAVGNDADTANRQPDAPHMPKGYVLPPGTETPRMGSHAIDPSSGEFNGKPFTATFIYGFYDGRMIFLEPMVSQAYLEARPDFAAAVAAPDEYSLQAYYPTQYRVRYDDQEQGFVISLENLVSKK
jgi:hypothetical protein